MDFLLGLCFDSLPLFVLAYLVYGHLYLHIAEIVFRFSLVKLSLGKYLDVYGEFFLYQICLCTIAPAVVIAFLEEAVCLISGFRSEGPPIWIWTHLCWGLDHVISLLTRVNTFADAVEKTKNEVVATRTFHPLKLKFSANSIFRISSSFLIGSSFFLLSCHICELFLAS